MENIETIVKLGKKEIAELWIPIIVLSVMSLATSTWSLLTLRRYPSNPDIDMTQTVGLLFALASLVIFLIAAYKSINLLKKYRWHIFASVPVIAAVLLIFAFQAAFSYDKTYHMFDVELGEDQASELQKHSTYQEYSISSDASYEKFVNQEFHQRFLSGTLCSKPRGAEHFVFFELDAHDGRGCLSYYTEHYAQALKDKMNTEDLVLDSLTTHVDTKNFFKVNDINGVTFFVSNDWRRSSISSNGTQVSFTNYDPAVVAKELGDQGFSPDSNGKYPDSLVGSGLNAPPYLVGKLFNFNISTRQLAEPEILNPKIAADFGDQEGIYVSSFYKVNGTGVVDYVKGHDQGMEQRVLLIRDKMGVKELSITIPLHKLNDYYTKREDVAGLMELIGSIEFND